MKPSDMTHEQVADELDMFRGAYHNKRSREIFDRAIELLRQPVVELSKEEELALACRVLDDHDMLEEADKLRERAK